MNVRETKQADIPRLCEIFEYAQNFMAQTGNPNQWKKGHPGVAVLEEDIELNRSFVVEDEGKIVATFMLTAGPDPTYSYIEDGAWPDDEPYGVIHRIASDGSHKGILKAAVEFAETRFDHVRIDTHKDNKVMQHLVSKCGFEYCGIIYLLNGDPRLAYAKERE